MALRVRNLLRDLPVHEQVAVLAHVGIFMQAQAKSAELAAAVRTLPGDEHYPQ